MKIHITTVLRLLRWLLCTVHVFADESLGSNKDECNTLNNTIDGSGCDMNKFSHDEDKLADPKVRPQKECGLYMAESAIPNSGLGMYTAIDIPAGQPIFYPDIVINLVDYLEPEDIIDRYSWNSASLFAANEAEDVESLIPGLGSLANSHPALKNVKMLLPKVDSAGYHRYFDPGVGAYSSFHELAFEATEHIPAGMELFVDYGVGYFEDVLENDWVHIPMSDDYEQADTTIWKYWKLVRGEANTPFARTLWDFIRNLVEYNKRLLVALPSDLKDVEKALKMGTARFSTPSAVRTLEWLTENGQCLDNIRPGRSTAKQAGRGAFATRTLQKGSVIAPAPLLHVRRDDSVTGYYEDLPNGTVARFEQQQLFLNYCFSHRRSSLLLHPYSPTVQFINHDGKDPNAFVRWSNNKFHKSEWLHRTVDDILSNEMHTGLMLEFVASRNINEGEEIFIDYGAGWEEAWNTHVNRWEPDPYDKDYVPISVLNNNPIVKTAKEQESEPYPDEVSISCFIDVKNAKSSLAEPDVLEWVEKDHLFEHQRYAYPCKILSRDETNSYRVELTTGGQGKHLPRRAILFTHKQYNSDQFIPNAFRHEIEIPDDIFPDIWMDK